MIILNIGKRIKELRSQANITSSELAKLINVSQPVISKLENSNRIPDIPTIEKICEALHITLVDFFSPEGHSIAMSDDVRELVNITKDLSNNQVKALIQTAKAMRK